jgi:hypothetical protein
MKLILRFRDGSIVHFDLQVRGPLSHKFVTALFDSQQKIGRPLGDFTLEAA